MNEKKFQQFSKVYAQQYGQDRWNNKLMPALCQPTEYCCLINRFVDPVVITQYFIENTDKEESNNAFTLNQLPFISIPCLAYNLSQPVPTNNTTGKRRHRPFPPPTRDIESNLKLYYCLDPASVLLSECLNLSPAVSPSGSPNMKTKFRVLDMCAAPGGKSLSIAMRLFSSLIGTGSGGDLLGQMELVCNEIDLARRKRLQSVLRDYLPSHLFDKGLVKISGFDGTQASHKLSMIDMDGDLLFDRILIDAPCSSERHLIHNAAIVPASTTVISGEFDWSTGKSQKMANRQFQLLSEGLKCLKVGGMLVYATCSISRLENDGVIERCLREFNRTNKSTLVQCAGVKWRKMFINDKRKRFPIGEPTEFGWIVLPDSNYSNTDISCGYGPLYFSLLQLSPNSSGKIGK